MRDYIIQIESGSHMITFEQGKKLMQVIEDE